VVVVVVVVGDSWISNERAEVHLKKQLFFVVNKGNNLQERQVSTL
jgi:hypothetical protein